MAFVEGRISVIVMVVMTCPKFEKDMFFFFLTCCNKTKVVNKDRRGLFVRLNQCRS